MNYLIILRDKEETEIEITEKEYETISKMMNQLRLFRLGSGHIINAADIKAIKPLYQKEILPPERRIRAPEMAAVRDAKVMEKMFYYLKAKGLFERFENYREYLIDKQDKLCVKEIKNQHQNK